MTYQLIMLGFFIFSIAFMGCSSSGGGVNDAAEKVELMESEEEIYVNDTSEDVDLTREGLIQFVPDSDSNERGYMCSQFSGYAVVSHSDLTDEIFMQAVLYDIWGDIRASYISVDKEGEVLSYINPFVENEWEPLPPSQGPNYFDIINESGSGNGLLLGEVDCDLAPSVQHSADYPNYCNVTTKSEIAGNILTGGTWSDYVGDNLSCSGVWGFIGAETFTHPSEAEYRIEFTPSQAYSNTVKACASFEARAKYSMIEEDPIIEVVLNRVEAEVITLNPATLFIPVSAVSLNISLSSDETSSNENIVSDTFKMIGIIDEGGQWLDTDGCFGTWSSEKISVDDI